MRMPAARRRAVRVRRKLSCGRLRDIVRVASLRASMRISLRPARASRFPIERILLAQGSERELGAALVRWSASRARAYKFRAIWLL